MSSGREQRRLSAILAADVAGYTRLVEQDTEGTVLAWRAARTGIVQPVVSERAGHIVKLTGDGFLAEFSTVEDAVRCAIAMQDLLSDNPLDFRMGISLGDVIDDGQDIHGEGVNIAARIEALADPGGIMVSKMVYEAVRNRVAARFEDMGEHEVKHVTAPVHVYRIGGRPSAPAKGPSPTRGPAIKPSIAVLPFDNLSGDPEQEFFADGMAEDIITGLSRLGSLLVIARNSTFCFKGQSIDVKDVADTLGVRYVLEGSIRKGGERVRVTCQLIDAESRNHIWAERYDRELTDIFAVQDEVTDAIVAAIAPEINQSELERARHKPPDELDTWDLYQRGLARYHMRGVSDLEAAMKIFDEVNRTDPDFAPAWAMGAMTRANYVQSGRPDDRDTLLEEAKQRVRMAIHLDPRDPLSVYADGHLHIFLREHDLAISRLKHAITLNTSNAHAHYALGRAYDTAGRHEECITAIDHAVRLSPRDPSISVALNLRAIAHFHLGHYEEAAEGAHSAMHSPNPTVWAGVCYAAANYHLGRLELARVGLDAAYAQIPDFSLSYARESLRHHEKAHVQGLLDTLRALDVPE